MPRTRAARRPSGANEAICTRYEELRALLPELEGWDGREAPTRQISMLLDLIERKQRQLIQDNVRLAGLREITEQLLREPDEDRVLRTISLYVGYAYGLTEVLVLSRTEDGGLRGYRARARGKGLCEAIRWRPDVLRGSAWEAALAGQRIEDASGRKGPPGGPPPLPVILPLLAGRDEPQIAGTSGESDAVIGLLALRPSDSTSACSDPLEIHQVAFQAATLLERVRTQRREARETRFRECLLEAMGDGLLATDSTGVVTAINRTALALLDLRGFPLVGSPIEALEGRAPMIVTACREAITGCVGSIPSEVAIRGRDGTIPVGLTVVRLGHDAEEGGGVVVTLSDLRSIRAMEEEVRRLDRLAALGRFATAVAHEIRNPLAAIGAGIDYLAQSLAPERQGDVELMRAEVARLDRIVRDLLEPAQKRPLQRSRISVSSLVGRACQANDPLCKERAVRLKVGPPEGDEEDPVQIDVDVDRMLQVIVNIIRNAIEASPEGGEVEIGWKEDGSARNGGVRIWILDRGNGIPPEEIAHIFEPFYSTKSGGTGLGLYVSHGVVGLHGGTLSAETVVGAGARFTIRLPSPSA